MIPFRIPMKWVAQRIRTAGSEEMDIVIQTVVFWHKQRYPAYERIVWSLPINNRNERKQQIDMAMHCINRWGENLIR